ncbi:AGAP000347-PA-like protein [Anopheles sinensis]|uniref:AGAP000347-PA-like protein n=1 Tax=Anopheles sinensis TaxID=74873 RepID=A0A084VN46_ANOSI|nr:AGAP000347-PA-like protein [Anopheles sinensis]
MTLHIEFDVGSRSKRGPTVGLFAFPRVGRSDPELASVDWDPAGVLPAVDMADDYEDYPIKEIKRQGLVPFPRVGRSGVGAKSEVGGAAAARYWLVARALQQQQRALQQQMLGQPSVVKRAGGSGANSGMWFGPRLGKRSRSGTSSQAGSAEQQQQQQQQQLAKADQL